MSFDFSTLLWVLLASGAAAPAYGPLVRHAPCPGDPGYREGARRPRHHHDPPPGEGGLFGFSVSRHIDLEDAQTIIAAIKETPPDVPIDLIMHTPGGLVLAAMQIARAVEAHPAKVTVYVPVYAMSGGTLIALAADEIVMGEFSMLGPIDPQIGGLPAASIVKARDPSRSPTCWT